MISLTGGLIDLTTSQENQGEDGVEEDIVIPVPTFGQLSEDESSTPPPPPAQLTIMNNDNDDNDEQQTHSESLIPTIDQLQIARCVNPYDPYSNEWQDYLTADSELDDLKEFEVLGFAVEGVDDDQEGIKISEGNVGLGAEGVDELDD